MKQAPSAIFLVRPDHFGFNTETALSNAFQSDKLICENQNVRKEAIAQFENFVKVLKSHEIETLVFDSPKNQQAPDAVFPNNWISMHENGKLILYPMLTKNRRIERNPEIVDEIKKRYMITEIVDLSREEEKGRILEGTGSVVFDHVNKIAYANESSRTDRYLFYDVCEMLGYTGVFFKAVDERGMDIYHTNVILTIGSGYAVICKDAIDKSDASEVINSLYASGLTVIEISYDQTTHFAGNMIEVENKHGERFLVMSESAYKILTSSQRDELSGHARLIYSDLSTIESVGGGSARCMLAGIHLAAR
jgi:hypothetical protein